MSAGTVMVLLLVLIAFDDQVREHVQRRIIAHPSIEAASLARQVHDLGIVLAQAAHTQSIGHAPLLIFSVAAAILVIFMLRT